MKNEEALVSVIIPVYNSESTLRRCVESLVFGNKENVEIVLVDDCSKDNSWTLCCELKKEFVGIKIVQNKINMGVSYTRNAGIQAASGDYLMFVDSDDWVSKDYAAKMTALAIEYPNNLVVCAFKYLDRINEIASVYCFDNNQDLSIVKSSDLFSLLDLSLLQSSCNKIFRREIVIKKNVYFDPKQSMGEDFQFVLDYMKAANQNVATVYNKPLYYYERHNQSSLMSNYGFIQNDEEYRRIDQLFKLTGRTDEEIKLHYITKVKNNYVYHISRNQSHTYKVKMESLSKIVGNEKAKKAYFDQRVLMLKNRIVLLPHRINYLFTRIVNHIRIDKQNKAIQRMLNKFPISDFSAISQNCIGGVLYHDLNLEFNSPTINAYFCEPDFINFVLNLKENLETEIDIRWGEEYPIGNLNGIQIHFMHYDNCTQAKEAWKRRVKRIIWNKIIIIATDRDGFTDEIFELWKTIPYPKILFTANKKYSMDIDSVYFPEFDTLGFVDDLIPSRLFYRDRKILRKIQDL